MNAKTPDLDEYVSEITSRVESHYADGTISLGTIVELFGVAGGLLSYKFDGDAGVMRAFEDVQFLAPAYQGDYVRVTCRYLSIGNSSRRRSYEAHVVARTLGIGHAPTSGEVLKDPILIASATGTVVVRADLQRTTPAAFRKA
ncbi:hotdog domain-containing protein [Mesorhizobium sp. MSK_1335]|uniref:Hotdog domain-containing protein n=1 Tax=Mesorhizobium montanum TaxID=3072323 RepID=A0ABU4ZUV6_9HYPH|nr:hotdog domain-containing protein [Mesorhizobium sp. MSK_1335]MDX8529203.1 hotdog domain-containing protein [Mesorhizobium sp. MSK_1335]